MVYIYGFLVALGSIMFAGKILSIVDTLQLQYYWLTVGVGFLILAIIQIVRVRKGYKIQRPLMFLVSLIAAVLGLPITIITIQTVGEFIQYEYGQELVSLGVIFLFTILGFSGERSDESTIWGSDNRSELSKKIDER